MQLAAAGPVSQDVPVPGGTAAMASALGVAPVPERARFVAELARLTHAAARSLNTTRAKAASTFDRAGPARSNAASETVPIPLTVGVWSQAVFHRPVASDAIVAAILSDPRAAHLCYGLAGVDDETLRYFVDHPSLITRLYEHDAAVFAAFGSSLTIRANRIVLPGGPAAARLWEAAVGEATDPPEAFIRALFGQKDGRLAYLYDTIADLDEPRAAFALGLWIKDPAERAKRFKALAALSVTAIPQWQPAKLPFTRPLHDMGSMLSRVQAEPNGSPSFPAARSWWAWAFESGDLPSAAGHIAATVIDEDVPVDATWLAQTITTADTHNRGERLDQFAFGQRVFATPDRGSAADVLTAIRAFPRDRMLMLTLERMGVRRASVYAATARRAQQLSAVDGRRAFVALAEFQGALALIARMASVHTLDLSASEALVLSLSNVPLNGDGSYAGAVAAWMQRDLRPAADGVRSVRLQADLDMEEVLFTSLAGTSGPSGQPSREVAWEGQRYRLDLGAAEEQRLRRIRAKQDSLSVDVALNLLDISRKLETAPLALTDVSAALKSVASAFAARNRNNPADMPSFGVEGLRHVRDTVDRAIDDVARIGSAPDVQKTARIGASLGGIVDDALADALVAWAYAVAIADADSPALLTGSVSRRHDFGFGPAERVSRLRAWAVPKQEIATRVPWHVSGSLLGLEVALSSLALRRVNSERVVDAPTLSANEREAFASSVALLDPLALRDVDRDLVADAVVRGRRRVASLAEDSGNLDPIASEIHLDGWRRRALQWMIANEPQQIDSMFSMTELLYLGRMPAADLNPWGTSAIVWSGCFCTRLAPPTLWRRLSGRPQVGFMAATIPDLNLHIAIMLGELQLPAAIAKAVLTAAVQDFIDEVRPSDFNDWLTLVRAARAVSRERIEDYVAAVTAGGPLVPAQP